MSDAQTTIILSAFAVVLILYVIKQERKSGFLMPLGKKKPRAVLGSKNKNSRRGEPKGCENVSIDSPDFERCATLGTGRTVIPVDPKKRPARLTDNFAKDDFALGNPLAKDLKTQFTKDDHLGGGSKIKDSGLQASFLGSSTVVDSLRPISRDGSKAFPFAKKGSPIDLGMGEGEQKTQDKSMTFKVGDRETKSGSKFPQSLNNRPKRNIGEFEAPPTSAFRSTPSNILGGSPSKLGMTTEELEQAANRLDDVDVVQRTTGGQLNLLR